MSSLNAFNFYKEKYFSIKIKVKNKIYKYWGKNPFFESGFNIYKKSKQINMPLFP